MSLLHVLLFFIFGTAVIARHDPDKPRISHGRPLYSQLGGLAARPPPARPPPPRPLPPVPVHIPEHAYGHWYRCDLDDVPSAPHDRINDVMRLYSNHGGTVGLYQLPTDTAHPGFPTFVRAVRGIDNLKIFEGCWIRFPTPGDSPESRSEVVTAKVVGGTEFKIDLGHLKEPSRPQYLRDQLNGYFYFLRPSLSQDGSRFADSGHPPPIGELLHIGGALRLFPMPLEGERHDSETRSLPPPQNLNEVTGLWLPYPMRGIPPGTRNRVADARIVNGRLHIGSFILPRQVATAAA